MFRLGYNTNGLPFHRPVEALELIASLGYEAVALTPDVGPLDPLDPSPRHVADARAAIDEHGLDVAVETGARFVLDPRRKHRPTLLEDSATDRERRVDFYRRSIDLAVELGARVVSLWSGAVPEGHDATLESGAAEPWLDRLAEGLRAVVHHGRERDVVVAFEPEPGMFVERPSGFATLVDRMGADAPMLTLDVGHCVVTGDLPVSDVVARHADRLVHVHLDDCPAGLHDHRMFGEGDLDLADSLSALTTSGFDGIAAVELSRDGHRGPEAAREALRLLRETLTKL